MKNGIEKGKSRYLKIKNLRKMRKKALLNYEKLFRVPHSVRYSDATVSGKIATSLFSRQFTGKSGYPERLSSAEFHLFSRIPLLYGPQISHHPRIHLCLRMAYGAGWLLAAEIAM